MGLKQELDTKFIEAMKAKEGDVLDVLRMIRSRAKKQATTDNVELTDELYSDVVQSYVKQMKRALQDYEKEGEGEGEMARKLRFEVEYLAPFLPQMMSEEDTRKLVRDIIAENDVSNPRQAGRVIGLVMKEHKGKVEPSLVKKIAEQELG